MIALPPVRELPRLRPSQIPVDTKAIADARCTLKWLEPISAIVSAFEPKSGRPLGPAATAES